jgi:TolB protein
MRWPMFVCASFAATIPLAAADEPRINGLSFTPSSLVQWASASGTFYQLQGATGLTRASWINQAEPVRAAGTSTVSSGGAITGSLSLFRLRVEEGRADGAYKLRIPMTGSLQNPAWAPEGDRLLLTRFRNGYNAGPADLVVFDLEDESVRLLVADGSDNVNLPGASWNPVTRRIVFSSARDPHDEIYSIADDGDPGDEIQITSRPGHMAYEPTLSPGGEWVVFESHVLDVETNGIITKYKVDGSGAYEPLIGATDDCRQPNWSPASTFIVYQRLAGGQWDLWRIFTNGTSPLKLTSGAGDKTDASFSPDGQRIVYSSDHGVLAGANLYSLNATGGTPGRVTFFSGYDGAPSWSSDGRRIAFESYPGTDPDGSPGTAIWVIPVPEFE